MKMSDNLRNKLIQIFPNQTIYKTELINSISAHRALYQEAKISGVSSRQFVEENGFLWKEVESVMDYPDDSIVQDFNPESIVNQIYASQALLGNAILTESQRHELYSFAKSSFDKRFISNEELTTTERRALILEAIFALQDRCAESEGNAELQSKMWTYLFKHFCGYTLQQNSSEYQRYYRFFCESIKEIIGNKHLLVPSERGGIRYQRYYDTLLIHALEPIDAANRFFSILFDFYVNVLECQYIPDDSAFKQLVKTIKAKWNDNYDSEVNVRSVPVSASFRTLLELCEGYSCKLCEDIIHKMDVITSGTNVDDHLDINHFRIDLLIYRWFQQQSRSQRKQAQDSRKIHMYDLIAIHKSDIHAAYELIDGRAYIVLPKIRFENEESQLIGEGHPPLAVMLLDGEEVHTDVMSIFGDHVYTSREYRFPLSMVQGTTFHLSVKIAIGESKNEIYNSGNTLYRDYLVLNPESGHEISNIQKSAYGRTILLTPLNSEVKFAEDSDSIHSMKCTFARMFSLDAADLCKVTVNGIEVYTDDIRNNLVRIKISPDKISSVMMIYEADLYTIHTKIEYIDIEIPEAERKEKYQVQLDSKLLPLAVFWQNISAHLPSINKPGPHKIEIIDWLERKIVCSYDYFIIPEFSFSLDRAVYFDQRNKITVQTYDATYGKRAFTMNSEPRDNIIQIPDYFDSSLLQLTLPIVQATFIKNGQHSNAFTLENRKVWVEELTSNVFLSLECPKDWTARIFLGCNELVCSRSSHLYEIGNYIQAYNAGDTPEELIMRLEKENDVPILFHIFTVHFKPSFMRSPLVYENGELYWEVEDNFIGNNKQNFYLYLCDVAVEPYRYSLYNKDEIIENHLILQEGIYRFIVKAAKNEFFCKEKEEEIYSDQLVIGEPNDLKYRNAILMLKSASCWDLQKGSSCILGLRESMTRITDLKYIDISDAPAEEDGKCPHYQGTLQFWNTKRRTWCFFCNDNNKTQFEWINPVDIWLINDHFLSMYSVTGDAVYIDGIHGTILNKAECTLNSFEKGSLQIPDKFEYELKYIN